MANLLKRIRATNFRCLADIAVKLRPITVVFGPNGAGKSSLLDTIWFVRDCAIRGADIASAARSHGIGMLWDGAEEGDTIRIALATDSVEYELTFALSSGRIEPFLGERLSSTARDETLVSRATGVDRASFFDLGTKEKWPGSKAAVLG